MNKFRIGKLLHKRKGSVFVFYIKKYKSLLKENKIIESHITHKSFLDIKRDIFKKGSLF